jgi:hypothetical protein
VSNPELTSYLSRYQVRTLLFILIANGFLTGGSGTIIRHNTQITHITQNNIPRSNKTQQTKHSKQNYTNNKGHTTHNEYNANTVTTITNTITTRYIYIFILIKNKNIIH